MTKTKLYIVLEVAAIFLLSFVIMVLYDGGNYNEVVFSESKAIKTVELADVYTKTKNSTNFLELKNPVKNKSNLIVVLSSTGDDFIFKDAGKDIEIDPLCKAEEVKYTQYVYFIEGVENSYNLQLISDENISEIIASVNVFEDGYIRDVECGNYSDYVNNSSHLLVNDKVLSIFTYNSLFNLTSIDNSILFEQGKELSQQIYFNEFEYLDLSLSNKEFLFSRIYLNSEIDSKEIDYDIEFNIDENTITGSLGANQQIESINILLNGGIYKTIEYPKNTQGTFLFSEQIDNLALSENKVEVIIRDLKGNLSRETALFSGSSNVFANVLGESNEIINDSITENSDPYIEVTSDQFVLNKGESTLIEWRSQNIDRLYLDNGVGFVDSSGLIELNPEVTTRYKFTGYKNGISVENSFEIRVSDVDKSMDNTLNDLIVSSDKITVNEGEAIEFSWKSIGNPQKVNIDFVEGKIAPSGKIDFIPKESLNFTISAQFLDGVVTKEVQIIIEPTQYYDISVSDITLNVINDPFINYIYIPIGVLAILSTIAIFLIINFIKKSNKELNFREVFSLLISTISNQNSKVVGIVVNSLGVRLPFTLITLSSPGFDSKNYISNNEGIIKLSSDLEGVFNVEVFNPDFELKQDQIELKKDKNGELNLVLNDHKKEVGLFHSFLSSFIYNVKLFLLISSSIISTVGFILSILSFSRGIHMSNSLLTLVYGIILAYLIYELLGIFTKVRGKVEGSEDKKIISSAFIRFFKQGKLIGISVSDLHGEYKIDLPSGEYLVEVTAEGFSKSIYEDVRIDQRGYVDRILKISKKSN